MGKNIIMKELVRYHMVFTGRVQGVGFRYKANFLEVVVFPDDDGPEIRTSFILFFCLLIFSAIDDNL